MAHSLKLADRQIRKGTILRDPDIADAVSAGIRELTIARLDKNDIGEDEAARSIASVLDVSGIELSDAGTGRVNFHATCNGVFQADKAVIDAINSIDPGITFATLKQFEPVLAGRMVATVKIIPYGISKTSIEAVRAKVKGISAMSVSAYRSKKVGVISTILPALKDKTIVKTLAVLERRLAASGSAIIAHTMVSHQADAIETEIRKLEENCDLLVIFGASAISDILDVIPLGLVQAGGEVERFGMPVDPGNLLMLGSINGKPVLGAPGCARSPAENGFDFVLNRLLSDIKVTSQDIAGMGVGGLLMEIGSRPMPRQASENTETHIAAIVLAGGQSRRMGPENKLTLQIHDKPMVCYPVEAAKAGGVDEILVVTGHESQKVQKVLEDMDVKFVENPDYADGLSTTLKAGISALDTQVTHCLVLLGDMPQISGEMVMQMVMAANTASANSIIMATHKGKRGNPVLWPRAHFDALLAISGDTGARHIIGQNMDHVIEVELGNAAALDIDTPQAFETFIKNH